jgi:DNA primase
MVAEVLPAIAEIHDPVLQAHYLQRLSRLGRVSEDSLRRQLPRRTRATGNRRDSSRTASSGETSSAASVAPRASFRSALEEFCLALLHKAPELRDQGIVIDADLFRLSENRELFARWLDEQPVREGEALREHYERVIETRTPQVEMGRAELAFVSCVARLEKARIKAAKEASVLALAEGEAGIRPGEVATIALERLEAGKLEDGQEDGTPEAAVSTLLLRDTSLNQLLHGPVTRRETGRDQTEGGAG